MADWLPYNEARLLELCERWIQALSTEQTVEEWHLDPAACVVVLTAINEYGKACAAYREDDCTSTSNFKKEKKRQCAEAMRHFARSNLRFNDYMSSAAKADMGLPEQDTALTVHPRPQSIPETVVENTINPFEKRVRALNRSLLNTSKPVDAYGVRYAWQLGGEKPASGDDLPKTRFSRRAYLTLNFTERDTGKPLWIATCYENARGEAGPWSPVIETHVW